MFKHILLAFMGILLSFSASAERFHIILAQNSNSDSMQNYLEQLQTDVHNQENAGQNTTPNQNSKPTNVVPGNPYLKPNPWGNTTTNPWAPPTQQPTTTQTPGNPSSTPGTPNVFAPGTQPTQQNQQNQQNPAPKGPTNIYQQ